MANETSQRNAATSFAQVIATVRDVLVDKHGVCDDGLWGAFRPEALRSIRTDAGMQQDIDTCWEFLTYSAALQTPLRSQQILEVASAASAVERWARRFWQYPVVDGRGRLHVWRLPMVTKPHSMEIAKYTTYALLQRCQCPEAAQVWLHDAPLSFRCRLQNLGSSLAPQLRELLEHLAPESESNQVQDSMTPAHQLRELLEKAPGSVSNQVQDSVTPAHQLAAAGANALNANLRRLGPMPPFSQEEGSGSSPRPSQAAGCSQTESNALMEPDAMQDEHQIRDHGTTAEEANEASSSILPSMPRAASGPPASEPAASEAPATAASTRTEAAA